jgi:hypothetical protein
MSRPHAQEARMTRKSAHEPSRAASLARSAAGNEPPGEKMGRAPGSLPLAAPLVRQGLKPLNLRPTLIFFLPFGSFFATVRSRLLLADSGIVGMNHHNTTLFDRLFSEAGRRHWQPVSVTGSTAAVSDHERPSALRLATVKGQ